MNDPAMSTMPPPSETPLTEHTTPTSRQEPNPLWQALHFAASLQITVILFALSLVLIYYGTWVQKEMGIWTAVDKYFRSFLVFIPIRVLSMYTVDIPGALPYPGGWLLGTLLMINLLAAHAARFKVSWRRSGIFLIHSGIVVMMLGELVTGVYSIEGHLMLQNGEAVNYVTNNRVVELAVTSRIDDKTEDAIVIPERTLRRGGKIESKELPFDVTVVRYMVNAALVKKPSAESKPENQGIAKREQAVEKREAAGVGDDDRMDQPAAYVILTEKGTGKELGTWLVSVTRTPQPVRLGETLHHIALRFKRSYKPYTVHLINMRFDKYLGTSTPKNFSSLVRLVDPERGEDREVLISMNDPLRHRGETFYQSGMDRLNASPEWTQLAVVKNPGWLMPYFSCALVSLGMLIHFGLHLIRFLETRP